MKPPLSTEVFPLNIVLVAYLFLLFLCQGASSALHPYKKLYFSFTQNHWSPPFRNSNGTKPAGEGNTANVHFTNTPSPRAPNTQFLPAVCCWLRAHTHTEHAHSQLQPKLLPPLHPQKAQSCSIPNWSLDPAPLRDRLLLENTGKTCSVTKHCKQG